MTTEPQERLARALETLAAQVAAAPRTVVGMQVSVVAGPGSKGNVTGMRVTATGGPGGGNVTGLHVQAGMGPDPAAGLVKEMREAASAVRENKAAKGWLAGLLDRAKSLQDRAVDAGAAAAVEHTIKAVFG